MFVKTLIAASVVVAGIACVTPAIAAVHHRQTHKPTSLFAASHTSTVTKHVRIHHHHLKTSRHSKSLHSKRIVK